VPSAILFSHDTSRQVPASGFEVMPALAQNCPLSRTTTPRWLNRIASRSMGRLAHVSSPGGLLFAIKRAGMVVACGLDDRRNVVLLQGPCPNAQRIGSRFRPNRGEPASVYAS
jgi:hypothetical protein